MQTITTHERYADFLERLLTQRLVREPERRSITGTSRAHWARLEAMGRAPRRILLSQRIVAWKLTELQRWVALRSAGQHWTEVEAAR